MNENENSQEATQEESTVTVAERETRERLRNSKLRMGDVQSVPGIPGLSESFRSLNRAKVKYAALSGYEGVPLNPKHELVLITNDENAVVSILGLEKIGRSGTAYRRKYGSDTENLYVSIKIIPKGEGYFPDRFESELIQRTEMHEDTIKIPQSDLHARAILYTKLHREGWLKEEGECRRVMINNISQTVGPGIPCKLGGVPFYK